MKKSVTIACTAIIMGSTVAAMAGGDPASGQIKAVICSGCHGVDGNSPDPDINPSLAGMNENYLFAATKAYTDGKREHDAMRVMLINFSDQDIANISAFYASQIADD